MRRALWLAALLALSPGLARARALWTASGAVVTTGGGNQLVGLGLGMTASDGAGGAFFVWADSRNVATSGMNVYAMRLDSSGNPVAGWSATGTQISNTPAGDSLSPNFPGRLMPTISADGTGGAFIVWQDFRDGNADVYAQRVSAAGALLWGAGIGGVLVSSGPTVGGEQGGASFVADDGVLFALFYDSAPIAQGGLSWRIQKLALANGAPQFGTFGKLVSSTTVQGYEGISQPVTDGASGLLAAWSDKRSGTADAYAFRVNSSGDRLWEIVLSSAANDQGVDIQAVSDGSGGLFAVWVDSRAGGGELDIYATRIANTGAAAAGWSIGVGGGTAVCASTGAQSSPLVDRLGADMVAGWYDVRHGTSSPSNFLQRMSGAGASVWAAGGVPAFTVGGGLANALSPPLVVTSGGNIFVGTEWLNVTSGCGSTCSTKLMIGQALDPGTGIGYFGSTGTLLGTVAVSPGNVTPTGFTSVASANDATAIFAWDSGAQDLNQVDIFAQKLSTAGGVVPVPAPPGAVAFTFVSTSSVSLSWTLASGSTYLMVLSSSPVFATVISSGVGALNQNTTSYIDLPTTTYYFKVKVSTNSDASYSAAISTFVPPLAPGPAPTNVRFTFVSTDSVSLAWNLVAGSTYLMVLSSSPLFATVISSATGALEQNTTSYTGLTPATYYFKVKVSTNPDASYSAAISTFVPGPAPPPAPTGLQFTGVSSASLSMSWTLVTGSSYTMVLSTFANFSNPVSSGTGGLNQNTTSYFVPSGFTYFFKVKVSTFPDASYSASVSTFAGAVAGSSSTVVVSTSATTTVTLNPVTGPIALSIPAGAFGGANSVTVSVPTTVPPASSGPGGAITPLGPAFDISLAAPVAQFSQPVSVTMAVPFPAGANASDIRLAYFDPLSRAWIPELQSSYNAATGILTAFIWHNTVHAAVLLKPAGDLSKVTVYPNPVNFATAVRGTVKFIGLSANPTIVIYNMAGERVIAIPPSTSAGATVNNGSSGVAEWDGRNISGAPVARGTYLYYITDPLGGRKVGKIGVIR